MKHIIYTRPDGGVSIVLPVINTHPEPENITEDQALQRALTKLPPDAINPRIVEESSLPSDRTFRAAWRINGNRVDVDMVEARNLHRNKLRELRKPKMEALDVSYMRADERGDATEKQRIAAQKQALRDVTTDPMIEAAKTPDELKRAIPAVLKDS